MKNLVIICFTAMSLCSCLGAPEISPRSYYALSPELSVIHGEPLDKTLGIRPLDIAKPYNTNMAYLNGDFRLSYRVDEEWAEKPDDTITRALIDALAASGRFKDVGNAAEMAHPDYILTGEVRTFAENRSVTPNTADIEVRIEVREALADNLFWAGTLKSSIVIAENSGESVAAAMNKAMGELVENAAIGITAAEPQSE